MIDTMKKLSLPIRFGIIISMVLIAYFLIISLFNAHTNPLFSLVNAAITGFGIFETIRYYKLEQGKEFTYAKGFMAGIVCGFIATIIFTVFFLFYITEFNSNFISELPEVFTGDLKASVGIITFVVAIMGFATTVVLTLTCMQYFKNSNNTSSN